MKPSVVIKSQINISVSPGDIHQELSDLNM